MKKIIILLCFFLLSIEQKNLPTREEQQKTWARADWHSFSFDFLAEDSERKCFGEGCVHIFKNRSGSKVIVLVTMTDEGLGSMDIFETNKIPPDLDLFKQPYKDEVCPPNLSKCIKITDKKKFLRKSIKYAPIIDDKYFATKKGIKLGMTYNQVIKILGKPAKKKIDKRDKAKVKCYWEIYAIYVPNQDYVPLEGVQLEEAIKAKEEVFLYFQNTIEFVGGRVERISLWQFWPG